MGVYVAWPYLSVSAQHDSPVCKSQPPVPLHRELPHLTNSPHSKVETRLRHLLFWISESPFNVNAGRALNSLAHFQGALSNNSYKVNNWWEQWPQPSSPLKSKPKSWGPFILVLHMCPAGAVLLVLPQDPRAVKGHTETPVCSLKSYLLLTWPHRPAAFSPVAQCCKTNGWD